MQVALILGANPRNIKYGPRVSLAKASKWGIVTENVIDTEYKILISDSPTMPHEVIYQVEIVKSGKEQYISLYAKELV
jgi:hypothetical protein